MNPNRASTTVPTEGWFKALRPRGLEPILVSHLIGTFHAWALEQGIAAYRVPFQFSRTVRQNLKGGSFLRSSEGVTVTDLDGNRFYDLTGSYGVNVLGYDFYKECVRAGSERVQDLGPVGG